MTIQPDRYIKQYLAEIGRKGGKSKSDAKIAAAKANVAKAGGRPRKPDHLLQPESIKRRHSREAK